MNTIILQAQGQGGNPWSTIIFMGAFFLIFYFFMIRPQMKRAKEARKFQENLSVGDKVMTNGGIHGEIVEIGERDVVMKIDQGRMRVEKVAISNQRQLTDAQAK
ncbi:MAG: hypothetical protein RL220_413 [Bacteroidota bacterium]|jgi:preprotein translocase subunit YajC